MDYSEHLALLLACDYLSDLRYLTITPLQAEQVLSEPEQFPPEQYAEAARYITGAQAAQFPSTLAARQAIVDFLRHK